MILSKETVILHGIRKRQHSLFFEFSTQIPDHLEREKTIYPLSHSLFLSPTVGILGTHRRFPWDDIMSLILPLSVICEQNHGEKLERMGRVVQGVSEYIKARSLRGKE